MLGFKFHYSVGQCFIGKRDSWQLALLEFDSLYQTHFSQAISWACSERF